MVRQFMVFGDELGSAAFAQTQQVAASGYAQLCKLRLKELYCQVQILKAPIRLLDSTLRLRPVFYAAS